MSQPIYIVGAGGHARVLLSCLLQDELDRVLGFLDIDPKNEGEYIRGVPILLSDPPQGSDLINGIGSVDLPFLRKEIYLRNESQFVSVAHPSAIISDTTYRGSGSQIMAGVVVQCNSHIGNNVLINTGATVDHDCYIGHHTHIAPGVTISGNVDIDDFCHIGTGASVIQGINIGYGCFVAAGSIVHKNMPAGSKWRGTKLL